MEENKEVFISEEQAIEQLDKIDDEYKKKKKENKHKKKEKSPKPRKPKYTRSGEKSKKKTIIIILVVVGLLLVLALVIGATYFYIEKKNIYSLEKDIINAANKYYGSTNEEFKGLTIEIKNGKANNNSLKLQDLPKEGTINIDKDGLIAYSFSLDNYCLVKNTYDKKSSIKKGKDCALDMIASEYIIKNNKDFKEDDENTGYDESLDYSSKYYVEGANPSNYIVLSNRCFRIINIANNGDLKAIYDGYYDEKGCTSTSGGFAMIERTLFDENTNNILSEENSLNILLNSYNEKKSMNDKITFTDEDYEKIANATWYVGAVNNSGSLLEVVKNERTNKGRSSLNSDNEYYQYKAKIGLINPSDFIKASANEKCNGMDGAYSNSEYECSKDNYLFLEGYPTWTMNAHGESNNRSWRLTAIGSLLPVLVSNDKSYIRPVVYIKGNVVVNGEGTKNKPYIVE